MCWNTEEIMPCPKPGSCLPGCIKGCEFFQPENCVVCGLSIDDVCMRADISQRPNYIPGAGDTHYVCFDSGDAICGIVADKIYGVAVVIIDRLRVK